MRSGHTGTGAHPPRSPAERDRRHVWHPWSPQSADRAQLMLARGSGYLVWDTAGRRYIDGIASALNATCGYGHTRPLAAIAEQLARLHHFDLSVGSHEPVGLLAARIAGLLPPELDRTLFVNSGSEAVEAALLIAAAYWTHLGAPRTRVVTFARGYHGATLLARSLSGLPATAHPLPAPLPVTRVDLPAPPRLLRDPESLPALVAAFERALGTGPGGAPMAVLVEPFLNVGGGVVLPAGFLRALRRLCDATGALLVLDEVFTGFGRTGRMFARDHEDVVPDLLLTSKGLSGGYVPIGAVTAHRRVHETFAADPVLGGLRHGHTTSGHAVACAGALATLDVLEHEGLIERAAAHGRALLDGLEPLAARPGIVDVRGLGLVSVLETVSARAATGLVARARDAGLLLRQQGATVMVMPPLVIDREGVAAIVERLGRCVAAGAP